MPSHTLIPPFLFGVDEACNGRFEPNLSGSLTVVPSIRFDRMYLISIAFFEVHMDQCEFLQSLNRGQFSPSR